MIPFAHRRHSPGRGAPSQPEPTRSLLSSLLLDETLRLDAVLRAARVAQVGVREQLVERHRPADQALLVGIADDSLEVLAVGLVEAVGPWIRAQDLPLLFPGSS